MKRASTEKEHTVNVDNVSYAAATKYRRGLGYYAWTKDPSPVDGVEFGPYPTRGDALAAMAAQI